jgi:hypothetical protein
MSARPSVPRLAISGAESGVCELKQDIAVVLASSISRVQRAPGLEQLEAKCAKFSPRGLAN